MVGWPLLLKTPPDAPAPGSGVTAIMRELYAMNNRSFWIGANPEMDKCGLPRALSTLT
jgi:hypothetical protein